MLVREVMTIGVPVCRDTESCGSVLARLAEQGLNEAVVVVLDEDGLACGWLSRPDMEAAPARTTGEVMNEDIPTVEPEMTAETAAQLMKARGVEWAFLMHSWPGEPRPAAVISLQRIETLMEGSG
jgi:CBS domain-containing protein